jgi:phage tail sheath protein FI
VDAGRLNGDVGLATQKPAEFITFRFSQIQSSGTSATQEG